VIGPKFSGKRGSPGLLREGGGEQDHVAFVTLDVLEVLDEDRFDRIRAQPHSDEKISAILKQAQHEIALTPIAGTRSCRVRLLPRFGG
jgi:hypothetical protein